MAPSMFRRVSPQSPTAYLGANKAYEIAIVRLEQHHPSLLPHPQTNAHPRFLPHPTLQPRFHLDIQYRVIPDELVLLGGHVDRGDHHDRRRRAGTFMLSTFPEIEMYREAEIIRLP